MADVIVTDSDEILKIVATDEVVKLEDVVEELTVVANESQVVVKDQISEDIVIDVSNTYIISSQQPPDVFTPTNGQTVFTLSVIPVGTQILTTKPYLNGQKIPTGSYTISGSQLTVILPYNLESNDILEVFY